MFHVILGIYLCKELLVVQFKFNERFVLLFTPPSKSYKVNIKE